MEDPQFERQLAAWHNFIREHEIAEHVPPAISASWIRCWYRLNPYERVQPKSLAPNHLLMTQVASFDLMSFARPVMEDIYQFIERSESVLVLVNAACFVLDLLGDEKMLTHARDELHFSAGAQLSEAVAGTNAFALAINERIPVQVTGAEFFLQQYHHLAQAAAPIFDLTGKPLGALGVITPRQRYHTHALGMALAGARAIEGQIQADRLMAEQNSQLAQLNAILSANSEGIVVWNSDFVLMHINEPAQKFLGLPVGMLSGRHIREKIAYPSFIQEAVEQRRPLTDVEATIQVEGKPQRCILSLRFVEKTNGELEWIIAIMRQEGDVRRLAQNQFGAQAVLTLDDIPGDSAPIQSVRRFVRTAAPVKASIFIRGESGTGKNALASAIHNASNRRDGPFLVFTCSTVPNELLNRELLGYDESLSNHRPGGRPSKFELAHGGTLFFQDIDALPLEAQTILLNMLEMGIIQRLGSNLPIQVDVRVIASSSARIEKLVAQGSFRADLYYRLSTFEIALPPLRERISDLPILVDRILTRLSRQLNRSYTLAPEVMVLFSKYAWPGNIRELEKVLARAAIQTGASELIGSMHLPENILNPSRSLEQSIEIGATQPLDQIEREAILQVARLCKGNTTEMARILGISRTTIWRKLKEFSITADDFRTRPVRN